MCIVIDANVLPSVFNPLSSAYQEFRPVLDWITEGKGKVVYGGRKYKEELSKIPKYTNFLVELRRIGKVVVVDEANNVSVDSVEEGISQKIQGPNFNDHHIVAIVLVSGCKLVCSYDTGLYALISACYSGAARALLKGISPYLRHVQRPKIYKSRRNVALLCDRNIAKCCQPC